MRLFAYIVARDYGFAPNPFHGVCTLATCKPRIRNVAQVGDMIVGMGSATKGLIGHMIYAMRVAEVMTFNEYWSRPEFSCKRPYLAGSKKQQYGDNIYHQDANGEWIQEDSHHSLAGGQVNEGNLLHDISSNCVLIGRIFFYFGKAAPKLCPALADLTWQHPGHKTEFSDETKEALETFLATQIQGYQGVPVDW